MVLNNACRLCLTEENLIWVFDKRFENGGMMDVVYITTGVKITSNDIVSQKICGKCCEVTVKMFQFRKTSQRSDNYLKDRSKQCRNPNSTETSKGTIMEVEKKFNSTETSKDTIMEVEKKFNSTETSKDTILEVEKKIIKTEVTEIPETPQGEQTQNRVFKIHPSIQSLYNVYPGLRLPDICLQYDFAPIVTLPMNGVEKYFKDRKLDFNLHTKLALTPPRAVATKKTSGTMKSKSSNVISYKNENGCSARVIGVANRDNSTNKISIKFTKENSETHNKTSLPLQSSGTTASSVSNNTDNVKSASCSELKLKHVGKKPIKIKRKLSDVEKKSHDEVTKKPAFVNSLGLTAKPNTSESPAYVANVSVPLHICNLCNSVQYSAKDLRKHQNKHLRCQFCKVKLRSLESKKQHLNNLCAVKNAMNGLPNVILEKIEFDREIRRRYPNVFSGFRPLNNEKTDVTRDVTDAKLIEATVSSPTPKKISHQLPNLVVSNNTQADIIEIDSDDEESAPPPTKNTEISNSVPSLTHQRKNGIVAGKDNTAKTNLPNSAPQSSNSIPQRFLPVPQNIIYNTVSIVKPDVRINDNHILDNLDPKISDITLLKNLLLKYKSIEPFTEQCTQTDLPSNDSISILHQADRTVELKNLKQQMYAYKIPVLIRNGPFNVCYEKYINEKPPGKLDLWLNLTPIDIKPNNVNIPKPSNSDERMVRENERQTSDINTHTNMNYFNLSSASIDTTNLAAKTPIALPSIVTCNTPVSNSPVTNFPTKVNTNFSAKITEYMATSSTCTSVSDAPSLVPSTNNNINIYGAPVTFNSLRDTITQSHTVANTSINRLLSNNCEISNSNIVYSNNNVTNNLRIVEPQANTATNNLIPNPTLLSATLVPSDSITIGTIRVKNVWELT